MAQQTWNSSAEGLGPTRRGALVSPDLGFLGAADDDGAVVGANGGDHQYEALVGKITKSGQPVDRILENRLRNHRADDGEQLAVIVVRREIAVDEPQFTLLNYNLRLTLMISGSFANPSPFR